MENFKNIDNIIQDSVSEKANQNVSQSKLALKSH